MRNVRLIIEYDGTDYAGWQRQTTGLAIQEVLEKALGEITGERVTLLAAGRTDAGVHALGQVANFHTASRIPPAGLVAAVNHRLPPAIVVHRAEEVPDQFHAQYHALSKRYRYTFFPLATETQRHRGVPSHSSLCLRGSVASPFEARWMYRIRGPLDVERMRRAARVFLGAHDFSAFEAANSQRKGDAVRTVLAADLLQVGPRIILEVEADGFLYKMVRTMAGTLVDVGRGRRTIAKVRAALAGRERSAAGPTAPARGLCLLWVKY